MVGDGWVGGEMEIKVNLSQSTIEVEVEVRCNLHEIRFNLDVTLLSQFFEVGDLILFR